MVASAGTRGNCDAHPQRADRAYLITENGVLALGDAAPGRTSAEWQVEPVEGTFFVRFRNASTGLYLALQEVAGPLGVVSLDPTGQAAEPGAPRFRRTRPGAANDTAPAIAEWKFIVATGIPLIAAPAVPIQTVVPQAPEVVRVHPHVRRRENLLSRSLPLPVDAVEENGFCHLPQFTCNGGRILHLQCVCPGGRMPIATGPRELTCLHPGGPPPCPAGTIRTLLDGATVCTSTRCPPGEFFSLNQMRCVAVGVRRIGSPRTGICVPRTMVCIRGTVVGGQCRCAPTPTCSAPDLTIAPA